MGPAMCSKILQMNGQIVYLSTYHALTQDEIDSPEEKKLREEFDAAIKAYIGDSAVEADLTAQDSVTPEYEVYEDDGDGRHESVPDIDDVTPEAEDNCIGADVTLSHRGEMLTGRTRRRTRNESELYG